MKTQVQRLARQLEENYAGDPWYGDPIETKLEAVGFEEAGYKPHPEAHSIAQILKHMIAWRHFALHKLRNNDDFDIALNSTADWDLHMPPPDATAWQELKDEFAHVQDELLRLLGQKTDRDLEQQVNRRPYQLAYLIDGIAGHDLYHLGQIGYVQGLWKKRAG